MFHKFCRENHNLALHGGLHCHKTNKASVQGTGAQSRAGNSWEAITFHAVKTWPLQLIKSGSVAYIMNHPVKKSRIVLPLFFASGDGGCSVNTSGEGDSGWSKSFSIVSMSPVRSESSELCLLPLAHSLWGGLRSGSCGRALSVCCSCCWGADAGGCWRGCSAEAGACVGGWLCLVPLALLPVAWVWAAAPESRAKGPALLTDCTDVPCAEVLLGMLELGLDLMLSTSGAFLLLWRWAVALHCLWLPVLDREDALPAPQIPLDELWLESDPSAFKLEEQ